MSRSKALPQLVPVADWYSIHALLQQLNSAVLTSSSLSLEQKSTGSIIETCCWCRGCYQRSAALLETCLSSRKTMCQHIVLATQSSFCAVRHRSSSVLTFVASQQSWPQPGKLPHLGLAAIARIWSTNPRYGQVAEASCCDMGWISVQHGGRCSWSVAKKTGSMYPCKR